MLIFRQLAYGKSYEKSMKRRSVTRTQMVAKWLRVLQTAVPFLDSSHPLCEPRLEPEPGAQ
jgi:hypothetical protein